MREGAQRLSASRRTPRIFLLFILHQGVLTILGSSITNFGNDYGPLLVLAAPLRISPNFVPIPGSFLLLYLSARRRLSRSFSVPANLPPGNSHAPPSPTPYVDNQIHRQGVRRGFPSKNELLIEAILNSGSAKCRLPNAICFLSKIERNSTPEGWRKNSAFLGGMRIAKEGPACFLFSLGLWRPPPQYKTLFPLMIRGPLSLFAVPMGMRYFFAASGMEVRPIFDKKLIAIGRWLFAAIAAIRNWHSVN